MLSIVFFNQGPFLALFYFSLLLPVSAGELIQDPGSYFSQRDQLYIGEVFGEVIEDGGPAIQLLIFDSTEKKFPKPVEQPLDVTAVQRKGSAVLMIDVGMRVASINGNDTFWSHMSSEKRSEYESILKNFDSPVILVNSLYVLVLKQWSLPSRRNLLEQLLPVEVKENIPFETYFYPFIFITLIILNIYLRKRYVLKIISISSYGLFGLYLSAVSFGWDEISVLLITLVFLALGIIGVNSFLFNLCIPLSGRFSKKDSENLPWTGLWMRGDW